MTVALAFSGWGDALMTRLGVATLIGYQSFRIVVEIFLWWGHREGVVPVQMTWEGRNFDVLTGLLALPLVWMGARAPRWLIAGWNVLGLGLLVNVVSVAVLSIPGPFQQFAAVNWFVAEFSFIWLPAFLVPSALMGHLLVWRWMGRGGSDG